MLAGGHKIGEPAPIIKEIKPETAEELKVKFAGGKK